MGRLASQTATQKLSHILGLLVIPILVLWASYFVQAKSEIDTLSLELLGAEFAAHVIIGNVADTRSVELESLIGVSEEARVATNGNGNSVLQKSSELDKQTKLTRIYRASGLMLDTDADSNTLAETALVLLPKVQQKSSELLSRLSLEVEDARAHVLDVQTILSISGEAQTTLKQINDNMIPVVLSGAEENDKNLAKLADLGAAIERATLHFIGGSAVAGHHDTLAQFKTQHSNFEVKVVAALQSNLLTALSQKISERRAALWLNLLLLTGAGLFSAIFGIGLAVLLVRTTFAKLDAAELAQTEAFEARREAEHVALRFSNINRDISTLNHELATKVRELKLAQDELLRKGKVEQLAQITATIAHEIRNPLGAIRTSAFMLERRVNKAGVDAGELIERINNSVNRCDLIITQLNDFSRFKEPRKVSAKLDDWLSGVLRDAAKQLPSNVFLECSLGLDEQQVAFDPVQLQRAVLNVLTNASEALQNTESQQNVAPKQKSIWVTTFQTGDLASIRITDNGPGISPEYLSKIREPLFTTKSFGSGLGIPVAEQIVQMQGGHLDIASELGSGATVTINLPLPAVVGTRTAPDDFNKKDVA